MFALAVVIALSATTIANAISITEAESFSGTQKRFSPTSGSLQVTFNSDNDTVRTILAVKYSAERALAIFTDSYNADYAGIDVKEVPDLGVYDVMDAYSVVTTLPDAKTDLENNNGDRYCDETEAIPFGRLEADKLYTMTTLWDDHRGTASQSQGLTGQFNANSEQSAPGLGDYNVIYGQWEHLTHVPFGDVQGEP